MKYTLEGDWRLSQDGKPAIGGHLPGCIYLDYMQNGMDDPFFGTNENLMSELGHHDYTYERDFEIDEKLLSFSHAELVGDGIDTVCDIFINGAFLGHTENINRTYRFDARTLLKPGRNTITLKFTNPYRFSEEMQKNDRILTSAENTKAFIRKTPCHFGWDWGPKYTPTGVTKYIGLEAFQNRIDSVEIRQTHRENAVDLKLRLTAAVFDADAEVSASVISPDGSVINCVLTADEGFYSSAVTINDPLLWWSNGLGGQPLYKVVFVLVSQGDRDETEKQIGLRTITLDTSKNESGEQFRFSVNGVPVFIKGCDWIPGDSFITRFSRSDAEFYVKACHDAGMNMLRVWGGGMYESEDFYDMCDRFGILVWQDFIFACNGYPFYDTDFLENVRYEAEDNLKRIRHRASLALLCGNNENELFIPAIRRKAGKEANKFFYYETLRSWSGEYAPDTVYWPGSPSSGHIDAGVQHFEKGRISGDSHLWNVWHGMQKIEGFKNYPTRFCSEFGMESMPAYKTIRSFNPNEEPSLFDDTMLVHQKSSGGNSKMLWYLLQKYRNPKHFKDFVYLSQIVQANAMGYATECWKRNFGEQNGALIWQLNDCWPVASWSVIDYKKQYKAAMYHAKRFNRMLMVSNDYYDDRFELYVINEFNRPFGGTLNWSMVTFDGTVLTSGTAPFDIDRTESRHVTTVRFSDHLTPSQYGQVYFRAEMIVDGKTEDTRLYLLVPDKKAALPHAKISRKAALENGMLTVTLRSDCFARYVFIDSALLTASFSDNYFDLEPGREYRITVPAGDIPLSELERSLEIVSLSDVEPAGTEKDDKKVMRQMFFKDKNFITCLGYDAALKLVTAAGDRKWKKRIPR